MLRDDDDRQLLVLAGGGHSHALLLLHWCRQPRTRPAHTRILLVSRGGTALYSGLVPAVVAGHTARERASIDLRRLCAQAGVTFVQAEIRGLDLDRRELQLQDRPGLRCDRLSLDVGAVTPAPVAGPVAVAEQAVKPLEPFLEWVERRDPRQPLRLRGAGAAAVELALAFRRRGAAVELLLRDDGLDLGSAAANRRAEQLLRRVGIGLHRRAAPQEPADLACTGSRAPAWLAASGLPVEAASGRVLTHRSLAVQGHPWLFACGDCALMPEAPRPPSGVWAVRAAPLLAVNLRRSLQQPRRPLRRWRPQALALQLLGDGGCLGGGCRALALYGPLALGPSRGLWRWKQRIDQRFMAMFQAPGAMAAPPGPMACRGCAAKLAAAPLSAALVRLQGGGPPPRAEDAVCVADLADGRRLLQSVDGFPALLEDPWLNARLTTLHACSDLWASGAAVQSVQALVTLPPSAPRLQEELLLQTLAGVRSVLDPLGAQLLGGHTLEARDGAGLSLALTVNGVAAAEPWSKGPLQPGAVLLLSRPLGSGVLFAAAMAGRAPSAWIEAALAVMQRDAAELVGLLRRHGCQACTDITGFGLLGHLGEMLGPGVTVQLEAGAIPAYDGALALLEQGLASSLAPANAAALTLLAPTGPVQLLGQAPAALTPLLIDPQTCGPLLAALPAERAAAALADLHAAGHRQAALIGRVVPTSRAGLS